MSGLSKWVVGAVVLTWGFLNGSAQADAVPTVPQQRIVFLPVVNTTDNADFQLYADGMFAEAMAWLQEIPGVEVVPPAMVQQFLQIPENAALYKAAKTKKDLQSLILRMDSSQVQTFVYGVVKISASLIDADIASMMQDLGVDEEVDDGEMMSVDFEIIEVSDSGLSVSQSWGYGVPVESADFTGSSMSYGRKIADMVSRYIQQERTRLLAANQADQEKYLAEVEAIEMPAFSAEEQGLVDRVKRGDTDFSEQDLELVKKMDQKGVENQRCLDELSRLEQKMQVAVQEEKKLKDEWNFFDQSQISKEQPNISKTALRAFCDGFVASTPQKQVELFTLALQEGRKDATTYIWRAQAFGQCGRMQEALADLNKAVELSPKRSPIYLLRGMAYAQQNNMNLALLDLAKALDLNPACINALVIRAQIRVAQQKFDAALADVSRAVAIQPDNPAWQLQRVELLFQLNKFDEALAALEKAKQLGAQIPAHVEPMIRAEIDKTSAK